MIEPETHFRNLERMYFSAPINKELYKGITLQVSHERAELGLKVEPRFFHAAHAMHGSVYFKMLDDAAFFAANSVVTDVFVYTVSINVQLLRPVAEGIIRSVGELKFRSKDLFIADSVLFDSKHKEIGRASGNFMKSRIALNEAIGYV